jgi:hypothetical protein
MKTIPFFLQVVLNANCICDLHSRGAVVRALVEP